MKKLLAIVLSVVLALSFAVGVSAASLNNNEKNIITKLKTEPFKTFVKIQYVNQLENYFLYDKVDISKEQADTFIKNLEPALRVHFKMQKEGKTFDEASESFKLFQKAGSALGLYLEYDSVVSDFYAIDGNGYIVIDSGKIIKDTDSPSKKSGNKDTGNNEKWNFSVEIVFACVVALILIGFIANIKRWRRKFFKKYEKDYDDEEDDELEIANRKTRKARLQTFTYRSLKQILKYFYVPIIIGLIVLGIVAGAFFTQSELFDSINKCFINTQPVYTDDDPVVNYKDTPVIKKKSIPGNSISWPKTSEQYGIIWCPKINLSAPLFMGDRDSVLEKGAGTYIGSSIPGGGNTILVGAHDTTFFKPLEKIKKGMIVNVVTKYARYKYKVVKRAIADEKDHDQAYTLNNKEKLVLYTCYPFGKLNGDKSQRLFVYLEKTYGPSITKEVIK